MPTDVDTSDIALPDPEKSERLRDERRGFRLAIGVAGIFIVAMVFQWPFAFLSAVFAAMFLQGPAAPGFAAGLKLVVTAFALLLFGYVLFSVLLPYRPTFMIAQVLMVMWAFLLSVTGKPALLVVLAILEAVMMPFLVHLSLDIAFTFAIWLPLNMTFALIAVGCAFALLPAEGTDGSQPVSANADANPFDPLRRLVRMTLVTAPFIYIFFLLDAVAVITLIFVAILSHQLAATTAAGPKVAKAMLLANLIGGMMAWIAYEMIVINTQFAFMALVVLLICLILSRWFVSGSPSAPLAATALTSSLILLGGAMAPFGDDIDVKMFDRLVQLGGALAWVLLSFVTVDEILPERTLKPEQTGETPTT